MSLHSVEADYLIIGSGAVGMAFADAIVKETDASIVMVDTHRHPEAHWNSTYPFVRLDRPCATRDVYSGKSGKPRKPVNP